jgi:hypothetical protein
MSELKNVREEKLNKLRQRNKDAFSAIQWLEQNRSKFKGKVFEPIFLLVRFSKKT